MFNFSAVNQKTNNSGQHWLCDVFANVGSSYYMPFVHSSKNKGKGGKALQALQKQLAICTEGCQGALAAFLGNASVSPSAAQASYNVWLNAPQFLLFYLYLMCHG